jgi:ribosomal protein S30
MERTEFSEMSEHKIQTPRIHPKERKQHSEHGENLKSRKFLAFKMATNAITVLIIF